MNPERVRQECVGAAMIVECVEHDLDRVVVEDVIATGEPGADFIWFRVKADEDDVQVPVIVAQIGVSLLGGRLAIVRNPLRELINLGKFSFPGTARLHFKECLQAWRTAYARDYDLAEFGRRCG